MIPDQKLERMIKASERTKEQLRTIKELEGSIDGKFRAVIKQIVVNEIEKAIKQLKDMYPSIDVDDPAQSIRDRFNRETWIEVRPAGIIYQFSAHTAQTSLLRRYALDARTSSVYLPAGAFVKMISDLKTSIMKGDMDQQIQSSTNSIIYTRMKQVETTYISEWRKQTEYSH